MHNLYTAKQTPKEKAGQPCVGTNAYIHSLLYHRFVLIVAIFPAPANLGNLAIPVSATPKPHFSFVQVHCHFTRFKHRKSCCPWQQFVWVGGK
jgi:hypothetical protein